MVESAIQNIFLKYDNVNKTATSFRVGNIFYPAPAYLPEIKGEEDLYVLLEHLDALPKGNPILIPSNKWSSILKPIHYQYDLNGNPPPIKTFINDYPLIFFDPPEFFRYVYGEKIVEYALAESQKARQEFKTKLKNKDFAGAINLLPPFFQPFVESQLATICKNLQIDLPQKTNIDLNRAWLDSRVNDYYPSYIVNVVNNALKYPNSTIIPPVPQLRKDSSDSLKNKILLTNRATAKVCNEVKRENKQILPYFHLYVDSNIFDGDDQNNVITVFNLLNKGINQQNEYNNYSGVAITFSDYERIIRNYKVSQLKNLVIEIINLCHEYVIPLPVIFPRSSWYGLYFADYGVQGFSSLLNGHTKYNQGSGGDISESQKFGKIPLIDKCIELGYNDVKEYLAKHDEFPFVEGLPRVPHPSYLHDYSLYRTKWSKPMRLIHIEECKRIRKSVIKGDLDPSKHYFLKSEHLFLKNL